MAEIVLTTLNAKYVHASFGLRYLFANLGGLQDRAEILEFTINLRVIDIAEQILAQSPRVVGFGVYIWNVDETTELVSLLRRISPELVIVLGGPEVSHEWAEQPIVGEADYTITGEGELAFRKLCQDILDGDPPRERIIPGGLPAIDELVLPYSFYTEADIANRVIYVEASRGCPFRCEFCLSSLDQGVRKVPLDSFLVAMQDLLDRGVNQFKFVDRTFNIDIKSAVAILEFFLGRLRPELFLHFEMIPDRLPSELRDLLERFPAGTLQLEVGIQTFNPDVGRRISRRTNLKAAADNFCFLREETNAHIHADLIVGLPGESLASFAAGLDELVSLAPQEIQIGILKRLRGTPIARHTAEFGMVYRPQAPYEILRNDEIDFATMQRLKRFARYWDLVVNSGNFPRSAPLLWRDGSVFDGFLGWSDWLYARLRATWNIGLDRLSESLLVYLTSEFDLDPEHVGPLIAEDYGQGGRRRRIPPFLREWQQVAPARGRIASLPRQARHLAADD